MALTLPETDRLLPSDKAVRRLHWMLVAAWLLVLYFQPVGFDEGEHLHVAWLMGEHGLKPFNDFFQHHMPLLWEVLKLYYPLGGNGPEALYFGRGVVLLCAALSVWGFYRIGALGSNTQSTPLPPARSGTAIFIAATLMMPEMFNIRPESLAVALFLWSYLFWIASPHKELPQDLLGTLVSGILLGLALLSSPRLLLLGGTFLLPTEVDQKAPVFDLKRLALLAAGALAALSGYIALSDTTFEELHFILSFSSLLQQVGDGAFPRDLVTKSVVLAVITLYAFVQFFRFGKKNCSLHLAIDLAYLLLVILGSALIAGKYIYNQDLSPIIVLVALLFVRGQTRLEQAPQLRVQFFVATIALWLLLLASKMNAHYFDNTVVARVDKIHRELAAIPPGESVLLHAGQHPILVRDASFYGAPLSDSQDRTCRAVRRAQADWPLPKCDYLADLESHRPYRVTGEFRALGSGAQLSGIMAFLDKHYMKCRDHYVRLPDGRTDNDMDDIQSIFSSCHPLFGTQGR